jgi:hypothetical protein
VRKETLRTELLCPSNVLTHVKSVTAQSFTVPSPEPVATHCIKGAGGLRGNAEKFGRKKGVELKGNAIEMTY